MGNTDILEKFEQYSLRVGNAAETVQLIRDSVEALFEIGTNTRRIICALELISNDLERQADELSMLSTDAA